MWWADKILDESASCGCGGLTRLWIRVLVVDVVG